MPFRALGLVLLLVLIVWFASGRRDGTSEAKQPTTAQTTGAPGAPSVQASATAPSAAATALPGMDPQEQAWRSREQAWCAQGKMLAQKAKSAPSASPAASAALEAQAAQHELTAEQARAEQLREWQRRLRAKADARSQALADWLLRGEHGVGDAAQQRLFELAQRTRDPFIAALAAERECSGIQPCARAAAALWLELEPHNLQAVLAAEERDKPTPADYEHLLERVAQTREGSRHWQAAMEHIWRLDAALPPGMRRLNRGVNLFGLQAARPLRGMDAGFLKHCRSGSADTQQRCAVFADRMWQYGEPELVYRLLTVIVAGTASERPAIWEQRAQETEAQRQWQIEQTETLLATMEDELECQPSSRLAQWAESALLRGELAALDERLRAEGPAAQRALSERYRRAMSGFGLLEAHRRPGGKRS